MIFTRWTLSSEHFRIQDDDPARTVIRDCVAYNELEVGDVFSIGDHSRDTVRDLLRSYGIAFVDCDPDKYRQSIGGHNPPPLYIVTNILPHTEWGMRDEYKIDYGDEVLVNEECECGFGSGCRLCGEIGREYNPKRRKQQTSPAQNFELRVDGSSGDIATEAHLAFLMIRCFELFKIKHRSYGSKNISALGIRGVFVRLNDKMARLKRLVWDGVPNPLFDETEEDTWKDIVNYALIGVLVREGKWPD